MILRRFLAFESVSKHLSETKAARDMHISQPSISRDIKALETEYNVTLFSKTPHGFVLTPEGKEFQIYVDRILKAYRELDEQWQERARAGKTQQLKIGIFHSRVGCMFAATVAQFTESHADVKVEIIINTTKNIEEAILNGAMDLGISKIPPTSTRLAAESFIPFPVVLFVAKNHPLAKLSAAFHNIARFPIMIYENVENAEKTRAITSVMQKAGCVPNISMRSESPNVIKDAVRNRLGVGVIYRNMIDSEVRKGVFKIIHCPQFIFDQGSFIVFHKKRSLTPAAQSFLQLLRHSRNASK